MVWEFIVSNNMDVLEIRRPKSEIKYCLVHNSEGIDFFREIPSIIPVPPCRVEYVYVARPESAPDFSNQTTILLPSEITFSSKIKSEEKPIEIDLDHACIKRLSTLNMKTFEMAALSRRQDLRSITRHICILALQKQRFGSNRHIDNIYQIFFDSLLSFQKKQTACKSAKFAIGLVPKEIHGEKDGFIEFRIIACLFSLSSKEINSIVCSSTKIPLRKGVSFTDSIIEMCDYALWLLLECYNL